MKTLSSTRKITAAIISYLYILLFVYAAVSKWLEFDNFQVQVAQSPLLTAFAGFISIAVLAAELVIAMLLSFPRTRIFGLFASFGIMLLFTLYILIILNFSPFVPCSCGGILENMGWVEHLYFNIIFTCIAVIALFCLLPRITVGNFYLPVRLAIIGAMGTALMAALFLSSEDIVAHSNSFTRQFPPFPAKRIKALNLKYDSYYFAGQGNGKIYLGNHSAPALITVIDTALQSVTTIPLRVKDTMFKFNNVQLRVQPPNFYIFDGTVPCFFSGNLIDRKAILKSKSIPGFTKAEIVDTTSVIIRTLSNKRQHLLSVIEPSKPGFHKDNSALLQKQLDGIFDTDGTLQYDAATKKFVYVYYYRNQYIVTDDRLNLIHRSNTIDTTTRAKIKVEYVEGKKQRKFSAPPLMVNRLSTLRGNVLFINSALRGKYDTYTMWNNANYIDVYDIDNSAYLMTFYVYKVDGEKISDMIATNDQLFVLAGTNIVMYRFSDILKKRITKNILAGSRSKTENL